MAEQLTILSGVVGSTAYGLDREGSDVDRMGIFVVPTDDLFRLVPVKETHVTTDPDSTYHEVGKFIRLASRGNPSVNELLWLEDYEVMTDIGDELLVKADKLLSEPAIRNAYGGYAMAQARKLMNRHAEGKKGFSSNTGNRTAKHARHCLRLLRQGRQLLETGHLQVRVDDPAEYFALDGAMPEEIYAIFEREHALFMACPSVLPATPDYDAIDNLLIDIRRWLLSEEVLATLRT